MNPSPSISTSRRLRTLSLLLASSGLAAFSAQAEVARPGYIADTSLRYDQVVSAMTHNAFSHSDFPQQKLTIAQQLQRGVRAFMLDVHKSNGVLKVCHSTCTSFIGRVAPLQEDLRAINNFLATHPEAIVTVHMEVVGAVRRTDFQAFMDQNSTLFRFVFNPDDSRWASHAEWPTLAEMIQSNQRLLLVQDRGELRGKYNGGRNYLMYDQEAMVQNTFSLGSTIFNHDNRCVTRWSSVPLDTERGLRNWKRLFLMNHFHSLPEELHAKLGNRWDRIESRILDNCGPAAKREPNFIAVDFVHHGDVLEYVEKRNNGGITAYEGTGASLDVVCGFSSAIRRSWSLKGAKRLGCENDEMKSLVLQGMKAGQRITLYDRPDGYRDDDFGILNIDKDIGWDDPQVLYDLERSVRSPYFRYLYSGGNGLNGKVSRISVEPRPTSMSDASFTLLREYNGNGRVSCGFGATRSGFYNLKSEPACHNDDAKSLRILVADTGTVLTVYDSPSGSTSDDYTVIRVKRPIIFPVVVGNLERNSETADLSVTHHRRNGLNGKVSSVRISVPGR